MTRPGVNLRGRLGHVVGIGTGAQPVDPNGRRQGGGLELEAPLEGRGAVALDLPELTTGDQGLLGRTGDLEVSTGGDVQVLSEDPVLRKDQGLRIPGLYFSVNKLRFSETTMNSTFLSGSLCD